MMQHSMLPTADEESDPIQCSRRTEGPAGRWRVVIAAAALVLCLLLLTRASLARRSHRRLSPGLVLASVLMVVLAVWLTVAWLVSTQAASRARTQGGEPLDAAVMRASSSSRPVPTESSDCSSEARPLSDIRFDERTAHIGWLLTIRRRAADALRSWTRADDEIRGKLSSGDYPGAVAIARHDGPQHSTVELTRLDDALKEAIPRLRDRQATDHSGLHGAEHASAGAAAIGVSGDSRLSPVSCHDERVSPMRPHCSCSGKPGRGVFQCATTRPGVPFADHAADAQRRL